MATTTEVTIAGVDISNL